MKIAQVILRRALLRMREPFETSFGREENKDVILVEVITDQGVSGFGECTASQWPLYSEETIETAWHMLRDVFVHPMGSLSFQTVDDLGTVRESLHRFKGNRMAKAALEMAIWDAFSAQTQVPLHRLLAQAAAGDTGSTGRAEQLPTKDVIPVGISVGIQPTSSALINKVEGYILAGFQRIKVKVKPGFDLEPLRALRQAFPDVQLMADANSAYRLSDIEHLRRFDEFNLMMMEQPLAHDDIVDHAQLQKQLSTPICLDESIHTAEDARKAIELGACKIINLKLGRIGGFAEAIAIHQTCVGARIPMWCGGMLETGIGRLHNVALTSLPGFTLPGDTAPSSRYFEEDLIDPPVEFVRPGFLPVEDLAGVARRVRMDRVDKWLTAKETVWGAKG